MCASASIGIALGTEGDDSVEAMLNHADMAMYRAKALGGRSTRCLTQPLIQLDGDQSELWLAGVAEERSYV